MNWRPALWGIFGGKYKIRYQLAEYINSLSPRVYLEAFCGYAWVGERVRCPQRHFSDLNENVVMMWQALLKGWQPPTAVSEEEYVVLKNETKASALRGFVGTTCAFGGGFFNTYARDKKDKDKNFAAAGARQMLRRVHGLRGSIFTFRDYRTALDSVDADVVYLDPPYRGTSEYVGVEAFDSDLFWNEIRKRSDGSRRILVSEYQAPSDFTVVMTTYSRMGLSTKAEVGLQKELREERVFEYQPPKGRRMVSFASLLD
jgi:hypothetical protein